MTSSNVMRTDLIKFLDQHRIRSGEKYTHTTKPSDRNGDQWRPGAYNIPEIAEEQFWDTYNKVVYENLSYPTLTEKPGDVFPMHLDFDFSYPLELGTEKRLYKTKTIKTIVSAYQDEIRAIVDPESFHERLLYAIVLQKPKPRSESNAIKDGFHIHFPYFYCTVFTQDTLIHNAVMAKLAARKTFHFKQHTFDIERVMDQIAEKVWCLYGSVNYKSHLSRPYLYTRWDDVPLHKQYGHAYDEQLNEISMDDMFADAMVGRDKPVRYYLPEFLSIRGVKHATALLPAHIKAARRDMEARTRRRPQIVHKRSIEDIMADFAVIQEGELMSMLSDERAMVHDSKMEVGWMLFNISEGHQIGLDTWKEFCQRADDYSERKCEDRWMTMKIRGMTMGTLLHWAKSDSPDRYKQWRQENTRAKMRTVALEPKPTDIGIAEVGIEMFKDRFLCSSVSKATWYEFKGHRWVKQNGANAIYEAFARPMRKEFASEAYNIRLKICALKHTRDTIQNNDPDSVSQKADLTAELSKLEYLEKGFGRVTEYLGMFNKLRNAIQMMATLVYDPLFETKKDRNIYYICTESGVLDMELMKLRPGRPDDYITRTTGLTFDAIDDNPDARFFFDELYRKIYPNPAIRRYVQRLHSLLLVGGNKHKLFPICTGFKDSGKTKMLFNLESGFGSAGDGYVASLPPQSLTNGQNRKAANGISPEELRILDCRLTTANEIGAALNPAAIKLFTGSDSTFRRTGYDFEGTDKKNLSMIFAQCNDLPALPGDDIACFDRIIVIPHESKFVTPRELAKFPVPDTEEERIRMRRWHADLRLDEKIGQYKSYLLSYLLGIYKSTYKDEKFEAPFEVIVQSDAYQQNNDVYKSFINDSMKKYTFEEDASEIPIEEKKLYTIKSKTLFTQFRGWYSQYYRSAVANMVDILRFKKEMAKDHRMGHVRPGVRSYGFDQVSDTFIGWKMNFDDDDNQGIDKGMNEDMVIT